MSDQAERAPQDRRTNLSLSSLFLDPNNYRFIDAEAYVEVPEADVKDPSVQRRTSTFLLGRNGENVRDLIDSFRKNGFLPVDQIQVRAIDGGKYLVVEGNRRVACLKYLQGRYEQEGFDLGSLSPEIFTKLPVVHYTDASDAHHLVLMGLKHISGNRKWPAINQAELIRTLYRDKGMSMEEICASIAIERRDFTRALDTLAIIDAYRESEFGDQFTPEMYTIFREGVRSRAIRAWIEWDAKDRVAGNAENLNRLFSWFSDDEILEEENEDTDDDLSAAPEEQRYRKEKVIVKSSQIRELAKLIGDERALDNLDESRSLAEATLSSEVLGRDKVKNALSIIGQEINTVFNMSRLISDADRGEIRELSGKLQGVLALQDDSTQPLSGGRRQAYRRVHGASHFTALTIGQFRGLIGIKLPDLRRINILAGINNAGKTSALEAVKLACSLTVPEDLFRLIRSRAKHQSETVDMEWFAEQLFEASVEGVFDGDHVRLLMAPEDQQVDDETFYLTSVSLEATLGNSKWASHTHLFEKYPERTEGEAAALCRSVMTSPFALLDGELIRECHATSLKEGSKQQVVEFLRQHMDSGIRNIELNENGRFTVVHDTFNPNPDLTAFGDGVQRIFKIGLLFAGARDGVVLVDELENAVHTSLLPKLAGLVHRLATKFNVQVFFATHSKECIDAFVQSSDIPLADVSGYSLVAPEEHMITCHHFPGEKLHRLVESIDFDLRGRGAE